MCYARAPRLYHALAQRAAVTLAAVCGILNALITQTRGYITNLFLKETNDMVINFENYHFLMRHFLNIPN